MIMWEGMELNKSSSGAFLERSVIIVTFSQGWWGKVFLLPLTHDPPKNCLTETETEMQMKGFHNTLFI